MTNRLGPLKVVEPAYATGENRRSCAGGAVRYWHLQVLQSHDPMLPHEASGMDRSISAMAFVQRHAGLNSSAIVNLQAQKMYIAPTHHFPGHDVLLPIATVIWDPYIRPHEDSHLQSSEFQICRLVKILSWGLEGI